MEMKCYTCNEKIVGKPWLHLYKTMNTYICSYKCCKNSGINGYWDYIVNKEDYKGIINPYMFQKKVDKEFTFLRFDEIERLSKEEKKIYDEKYDEYFSMEPERAIEEYLQMLEDIKTEKIEEEFNEDSSEIEYSDDY
tara:strand:- start:5672 stop:6082 length:411 start_codon:yes stop_codon:yes gene_type:complete